MLKTTTGFNDRVVYIPSTPAEWRYKRLCQDELTYLVAASDQPDQDWSHLNKELSKAWKGKRRLHARVSEADRKLIEERVWQENRHLY